MSLYTESLVSQINDNGDFLINESYYVMRNLQKSFAEAMRIADEIDDMYVNGISSKYVYGESLMSSIGKFVNNAWGYFIKIVVSIINYGLKAVSFILDIIKRVFGIELKINITLDGENVVKENMSKTTYGKLLSGMNLSASLKEINKTLPEFTKYVISDNDVLDPIPIINEIIQKTKAGKLEISTDAKNTAAVDKIFKDAIDAVLTFSKVGDNKDAHASMGNMIHNNVNTLQSANAVYYAIIKAMEVADDEFIKCTSELRTYIETVMKSSMKDLDKSKMVDFLKTAMNNATIADVYDDILSGTEPDVSKLNFLSLFGNTTLPNTDLNGTIKNIFNDSTVFALTPDRYLKYMSMNKKVKEVIKADFEKDTADLQDVGLKHLCTKMLTILIDGPNSSAMADLIQVIDSIKNEMNTIMASTNTSDIAKKPVASKLLDKISKLPNITNLGAENIVDVLDIMKEYGATSIVISKLDVTLSGDSVTYQNSASAFKCSFTTQTHNSPAAMITNNRHSSTANFATALEKLHVFLTDVKKNLNVEYNGLKAISSKDDIAKGIHSSLASDIKTRDVAIQSMKNTVSGYQANLNSILNSTNGILKAMVVLQGVKVNNNIVKTIPALEIYGKMSNTFYQLLVKLEKFNKDNTPASSSIKKDIQSTLISRENKYKGVGLI